MAASDYELNNDVPLLPADADVSAADDFKEVKKELTKRPFYTPFVTTYHRKTEEDKEILDSKILKRYYSVIDAEVYFGNEYVEDICYIDWNVSQNVMPLFGYNSYVYDEVARGNRLISGVFDINFTSPNYLFQILKAADNAVMKDNQGGIHNLVYEAAEGVEASKAKIDETLSEANKEEIKRDGPVWNHTFDIDVIFGGYDTHEDPNAKPVHIMLKDVVLQSCSIVMSASAAESPPSVRERYTFIARDFRTVVYKPTVLTDEELAEKEAKKAEKDGLKKPEGKKKASVGTVVAPDPTLGQKNNEANPAGAYQAEVEGMVISIGQDGTCIIKDEWKQAYKVSLYGIELPSIGSQENGTSVQALTDKLQGEVVKFKIIDPKAETLKGTPYIEGEDINLAMVKEGYAKYTEPPENGNVTGKRKEYQTAQNEAANAKIGIWSQ